MKASTASILIGAISAIGVGAAPTVDEVYPYTGPAVPVGDWVNPTVNGNGKGFPRLVEAPAVAPASTNPTNNINVISFSYLPTGVNIHFQTPFGLGTAPAIKWGIDALALTNTATGSTTTYDRTPPCSMVSAVTQCSQFFHDVEVTGLLPDTTYYYQVQAANGTTASSTLSFTTGRAAGASQEFSLAVLNDMGYTNAAGTYRQLQKLVESDAIKFYWHGGDISYADDWYSGILPCASDWPVCYNGTSSELPGGVVDDPDYDTPLPAGEIPSQGGPLGGDMSVLYESNWDLWQQWMNNITTKMPYMVIPGNHEASCTEFDGPGNVLTAYLNNNQSNATAPKDGLTYYSCPPSQRNFTAYQNRFHMAGEASNGVGNMWYSFDYGLAHFISLDGETDFPYSPEYPFVRDLTGNETHPTEAQTYPTDSGPFGYINGNWRDNSAYEQINWLQADLAKIDRTKTPWVFAMSHRPMWSSGTASYQSDLRNAFQGLLLQYGVDAYFSGHIHWYERLFPLTATGAVDSASVVNNNTYYMNPGKSMTHIINGMAGNVESHSTLSGGLLNITVLLDQKNYGLSKLTVFNSTVAQWDFIKGADGSIGDHLTLLKRTNSTTGTNGTSTATSSSARMSGTGSTALPTMTGSIYSNSTTSTKGSVSGGGATAKGSGTSSLSTSTVTTVVTSSVSLTTSTVIKTITSTISSCAATVTNCPYTTAPIVITTTVVAYTTVCPVSGGSAPTSTVKPVSSVPLTTSTIYKTLTSTISSCPSTVTNCPYTNKPGVFTSVVVDYTTVCPVSAATSPAAVVSFAPVPASVKSSSAASIVTKVSTVVPVSPASSAPSLAAVSPKPIASTVPAAVVASSSTAGKTSGTATGPSTPAKFTGAAGRVEAGASLLAGFAGLFAFLL